MQTLLHGENKPAVYDGGFILLRGLLVMFIVIICFAAVLTAITVLSHHGSRLLENIGREINSRNEIVLKRIRQ